MDVQKPLAKSVLENVPKVQLRPKSERTTLQAKPTSPYSQVYRNRSNSAPKHPIEKEEELLLDVEEEMEENKDMYHRLGCPRFKLKPKTRCNSPSRFLANHPRPWGARDPDDIPCYCSTIRMREEANKAKQLKGKNNISDLFALKRSQTAKANAHQDPHKEITDLFDTFCSEVIKRRVKLSKTEINEMSKKLLDRFSKTKEKTTVPPHKPTTQDLLNKNIVKRQRENSSVNIVNDKLNRSEKNQINPLNTEHSQTGKNDSTVRQLFDKLNRSEKNHINPPNTENSQTGKNDAAVRQLLDTMKASEDGTLQVLAVKCRYYSEGLITGAGIPQLEMDEQNKLEYNTKYQDASRGVGDIEFNQSKKTNPLFNSNVPKMATTRKHKRR